MCGWVMCDGASFRYVKKKCGRSQGSIQTCLSPFLDSHHGNSPHPLLWSFAKARHRSRYRHYVQWCRVCIARPWRSPSHPIRYEACISSDPLPRSNDDKREIGTQTLRTLDPQKFPPYCIMISTVISVALRTEWISKMTTHTLR